MKYTKKWMVVPYTEVQNNELTSIIQDNNITSEKLRLYRESQLRQNETNQKLRENINTHNSFEKQNEESFDYGHKEASNADLDYSQLSEIKHNDSYYKKLYNDSNVEANNLNISTNKNNLSHGESYYRPPAKSTRFLQKQRKALKINLIDKKRQLEDSNMDMDESIVNKIPKVKTTRKSIFKANKFTTPSFKKIKKIKNKKSDLLKSISKPNIVWKNADEKGNEKN